MLLWHCADYNSYQGCALPWKQELVNKNPTQKDYLNYDEENPLTVYPLMKEVEWGQEPSQTEYPKPNKDEDEWFDDRKD